MVAQRATTRESQGTAIAEGDAAIMLHAKSRDVVLSDGNCRYACSYVCMCNISAAAKYIVLHPQHHG
jgi:hypothetical protein